VPPAINGKSAIFRLAALAKQIHKAEARVVFGPTAECKALLEVLERVIWNRAATARILQVNYKTVLTKISECGRIPPHRH
jgi:hypothetical protein